MKLLLTFFLAFCLIGSANSQTLQKFSLGIQGGLSTPMHIQVDGTQPEGFKPERSVGFSKSAFLQYELSKDFYLRGTFKKSTLAITNHFNNGLPDSLRIDGSYGANFDNRQFELSLGYHQSLNQKWSIIASLGATYLGMKSTGDRELRPGLGIQPREPYWVYQAPIVVKERAVLANGVLGLEYKTRRSNVFSLELGYYRGFETVADYKFMMIDHLNQNPEVSVYNSALKSKGDYAEIRFGYHMPIQKFTNLYNAINNPKPKPLPEPDSIRNQRFIGKYWGLETGRQTFYSNQTQVLPGYTAKIQVPSFWSTYLTFYKGYQFKSRLSLEAGFRVSASTVSHLAGGQIGDGSWSTLTYTTPVSVKYAIPVLRNKIFLSPEIGLWQSYSPGMGGTDGYPKMNGLVTHLKGYNSYFVGYHAGLSLNGRVGKTTEIGIGYRFANRFTNKPLMLIEPDFDRTIEQYPIVSKSNLKNDAFTISFRKFMRK